MDTDGHVDLSRVHASGAGGASDGRTGEPKLRQLRGEPGPLEAAGIECSSFRTCVCDGRRRVGRGRLLQYSKSPRRRVRRPVADRATNDDERVAIIRASAYPGRPRSARARK